jgi:hypothetical protein
MSFGNPFRWIPPLGGYQPQNENEPVSSELPAPLLSHDNATIIENG